MSELAESPSGEEGVTRRDFARLGVVAGGAALLAAGGAIAGPNIRTISYAGKVVGSVHTPPTTESPPTSESTSPEISTEGSTVPSTTSAPASSTTKPSATTTVDGAADAAEPDGVLPFTGAAIGALAIAGGAAVAVGRAMAGAGKRPDAPKGQSDRG